MTITTKTRNIVNGAGMSSWGNPNPPKEEWIKDTGVEKKVDSLPRWRRDSDRRMALAIKEGCWVLLALSGQEEEEPPLLLLLLLSPKGHRRDEGEGGCGCVVRLLMVCY